MAGFFRDTSKTNADIGRGYMGAMGVGAPLVVFGSLSVAGSLGSVLNRFILWMRSHPVGGLVAWLSLGLLAIFLLPFIPGVTGTLVLMCWMNILLILSLRRLIKTQRDIYPDVHVGYGWILVSQMVALGALFFLYAPFVNQKFAIGHPWLMTFLCVMGMAVFPYCLFRQARAKVMHTMATKALENYIENSGAPQDADAFHAFQAKFDDFIQRRESMLRTKIIPIYLVITVPMLLFYIWFLAPHLGFAG